MCVVEAAGIEPASEINIVRLSTWLGCFTYTLPWWNPTSIAVADSQFFLARAWHAPYVLAQSFRMTHAV